MSIFISYRHTGEDPKRLALLLPPIANTLKSNNKEYTCTYFDVNEVSSAEDQAAVLRNALSRIDTSEAVLVVLDSSTKSEGMLVEVGYAIAKNVPIYMLKNSAVKETYMDKVADKSFEYTTLDELPRLVEKLVL